MSPAADRDVRAPEEALVALAEMLREEDSVISPYVRDPQGFPALGALAAAGPRVAEAPGTYALLVESIREGFLLHYGEPRVVVGADPDLALLAGDYLYARGLERLAARADLEAVGELSDLISLCAQRYAEDGDPHPAVDLLWLASTIAVGVGRSGEGELAKSALRQRRPDATERLAQAARTGAGRGGIEAELERAAESLGLAIPD